MGKKNTYSSVSLGDYIRKIRMDRGYSQYYMADFLGISQNSYCMLENGYTKFAIDRVVQIADIFKLSPQEFLDGYFSSMDR